MPSTPEPSVPAPGAPPLPPPAFAPAPAGPSPVGAFLGRAFRGGWAASAQAALWPLGMLLIASVSLAIPTYGQDDEVVVSFTDRLRLVLALLLQGLGGGFEVTGPAEDSNPFGTDGDSGFGGDGGYGGGSGLFETGGADSGTAALSIAPLTLTALWIAATLIGVRMLRNRQAAAPAASRTAGLEAAVRVALLATAGVLVLALFAQPTVEGVEISSLPFLSALGALGLTAAVAVGLLHRDDLAQWLAVRPGAQAFVRATATALRALAVVLAVAAVTAYLCLASLDDMEKEGLLVLLAFLPNIGAAALGIGWGGSLEFTAKGSSNFGGGGTESETIGLSELSDLAGDWALVGGLALGAVCALTVGVLAARRHPNRGEQVLVAGLFFVLLLVVCALSGLGADGESTEFGGFGGAGGAEVAVDIAEVLLFGLLWLSAAVFLGPYVLRMTGGAAVQPAPYAPYAPGYAPTAAAQDAHGAPGAQLAPDSEALQSGGHGQAETQGQVHPPAPGYGYPQQQTPAAPYAPTSPSTPPSTSPPPYPDPSPHPTPSSPEGQRSRVTLWVVTLTAALALGAGATAGFLLLQKDDEDPGAKEDAKPSVSVSDSPSQAPSSEPPTAEPSASGDPAAEGPSDSPATGTGSRIVTDPAGFSLAVPKVWSRTGEENGQITYAGSTGFGHFLIGIVPDAQVTSYENFLTIEKKSQKNPDYQRIRLEENTFHGLPGAIWEYTYTEKETGRTVHAIDQGYVAEDGTEYAIYFTDYEENWQLGGQEIFDEALATWRVTG
ncbi:hypothetical protein [Streptomyces indicus]|uniref:Uncharacterized protein n=1 Tax=Streptomyces indicus TaxID=417292 RepID=A0A1G9I8D3_9ACTN|nr:hypothetical protein [Streptomyces indicus]SDL21530.1 hypothetical protein SAMN05421806_12232 [Streptomyces indicus]